MKFIDMKMLRHVFRIYKIIFYQNLLNVSEVKELHNIKIAFIDYLERC